MLANVLLLNTVIAKHSQFFFLYNQLNLLQYLLIFLINFRYQNYAFNVSGMYDLN